MMERKRLLIGAALFVAITAVTGCSKTPSDVIDQEKMATVLADLNMGEAVVDYNYKDFPNDSMRRVLKQSIFQNHGITSEQFDSSLSWYGHNIEQYIEVYNRSIEILEERQRNIITAANQQIAISGDSVDVWPGARHLTMSHRMPMRVLSFNIESDSNWKKGDVYVLQFKALNSRKPVTARLLSDYAEGTTGYIQESSIGNDWTRVRLQLDSTLTPENIYGYIVAQPSENEEFYIDSISLVRMRKNLFQHSYFPQKKFNYGFKGKRNTLEVDTTSVSGTSSEHSDSAASAAGVPPQFWQNPNASKVRGKRPGGVRPPAATKRNSLQSNFSKSNNEKAK